MISTPPVWTAVVAIALTLSPSTGPISRATLSVPDPVVSVLGTAASAPSAALSDPSAAISAPPSKVIALAPQSTSPEVSPGITAPKSAASGKPAISLSTSIAAAGDQVEVTGTGPPGWGPCAVALDGREPSIFTCLVSKAGEIAASFTGPATMAFGPHTVSVSGSAQSGTALREFLGRPSWFAVASLTIETRVPDVIGQSFADAVATLKSAFLSGTSLAGESSDGAVVEQQNPASGQLVEPGSIVTLISAKTTSPTYPSSLSVGPPSVSGPSSRPMLTGVVAASDVPGVSRALPTPTPTPIPTPTVAAPAFRPPPTRLTTALTLSALLAVLAIGLAVLWHLARTRAVRWIRQHVTFQSRRSGFSALATVPSGRRDHGWSVTAVPGHIVATAQEN